MPRACFQRGVWRQNSRETDLLGPIYSVPLGVQAEGSHIESEQTPQEQGSCQWLWLLGLNTVILLYCKFVLFLTRLSLSLSAFFISLKGLLLECLYDICFLWTKFTPSFAVYESYVHIIRLSNILKITLNTILHLNYGLQYVSCHHKSMVKSRESHGLRLNTGYTMYSLTDIKKVIYHFCASFLSFAK